jgi:predicted transcriptional regulator
MSETIKKGRSEELRVKVTPEMKKRIDRIAELHGMPAVTWANHVVAAAVVDFERRYQIQNKTVEALVKMAGEMIQPVLDQAVSDARLIQDDELGDAGAEEGVR